MARSKKHRQPKGRKPIRSKHVRNEFQDDPSKRIADSEHHHNPSEDDRRHTELEPLKKEKKRIEALTDKS